MIVFNVEKKSHLIDINVDLLNKYLKRYITNQLNYPQIYKSILLNYNFVSKKKQVKINNDYLNHNYNTDIITFNISEDNHILIGEIYISLNQVRRNARKYLNSVNQEINRVVIHGCLHLFGYDDKSVENQKLMRKAEDKFLKWVNRKKCSTWNNTYIIEQ